MSQAQEVHSISVVVPVYRGTESILALVEELAAYTDGFTTSAGHHAKVGEVLLVHDHGPKGPDAALRDLAKAHEFVRPVWLSRNFGQHAATMAGMASSGGDWIATMDEDGQHDPAFLGDLLDTALAEHAAIVYAKPSNPPPHGFMRNATSKGAKRVVGVLTGGPEALSYHSYRLVIGEIGRSVASFAGPGVYLDVALGWIASDVTTCPVTLRDEGGLASSYNYRSLTSHFWRMVLTSGTRLLRLVSLLGATFAALGVAFSVVLVILRLSGETGFAGYTSLMCVLLVGTGAVLFSLGLIAEYIGVSVNMAMGKPLYLIVHDAEDGPHGRTKR
jgi:undecaprenyl-phosphate 4-deoxy-4-formamido-L-arabinose transferase